MSVTVFISRKTLHEMFKKQMLAKISVCGPISVIIK